MNLTSSRLPLVFDTTCLSHFARADRLDVLAHLLVGTPSLLPHVVREEIRAGLNRHAELQAVLDAPWLQLLALDTIDRLKRFAAWASRIGAAERNLGEASVLAGAEELGAIALIDDREATRVGREYGVHVHGTIWLLASACRKGRLTEFAASNLIDSLAATGMRLPCTGVGFATFAQAHDLFKPLACDQP